MPRPPFDPALAQGAAEVPAPDRDCLTVSEVNQAIKDTLEHGVPSPLHVIGEISNLSTPGHWYFSLKDQDAVVGCVAWASSARRFGFTPKVGDQVVVTGHISHYPAQGRTQLYVSAMAPVGAGALEQRFQALCQTLRGLGYFDPETKQPLPLLPRRIAVITSASGAAVHDVIDTARRRSKAVGIVIVDVRVQGDGAADAVADAIGRVDADSARLGIDAILVTRGGGSVEDLWAFNERVVADAAHTCGLPLVAAIGHESDTTVIELVADVRAATPTQAAMRLVPSADELLAQVMHLRDRLRRVTGRTIERRRERLEAVRRAAVFRDPLTIVQRAKDHVHRLQRQRRRIIRSRIGHERLRLQRTVADLRRHGAAVGDQRRRIKAQHDRLRRALFVRLPQLRQRLQAQQKLLAGADPQRLLQRGYSITSRRDGGIVRSVDQIGNGDALRTQVSDGVVDSVVSSAGKPARKRRSKGSDADQLDLFGSPS
jgi:exodeoxyribonuclease VII large subunit